VKVYNFRGKPSKALKKLNLNDDLFGLLDDQGNQKKKMRKKKIRKITKKKIKKSKKSKEGTMLKKTNNKPSVLRMMDTNLDITDNTIDNIVSDRDKILVYDEDDDLKRLSPKSRRRKTHYFPPNQKISKDFKKPRAQSRLDDLMGEVMSD
jgi:hypothetical protein